MKVLVLLPALVLVLVYRAFGQGTTPTVNDPWSWVGPGGQVSATVILGYLAWWATHGGVDLVKVWIDAEKAKAVAQQIMADAVRENTAVIRGERIIGGISDADNREARR